MAREFEQIKNWIEMTWTVAVFAATLPLLLLGPYRLLARWRDSPWCGGGDQVRRFENDSDELTTTRLRQAVNVKVEETCSYKMRRIGALWPDGFRCQAVNHTLPFFARPYGSFIGVLASPVFDDFWVKISAFSRNSGLENGSHLLDWHSALLV